MAMLQIAVDVFNIYYSKNVKVFLHFTQTTEATVAIIVKRKTVQRTRNTIVL